MGNRAALWLLRIAFAQMVIGGIVVTASAAQRDRADFVAEGNERRLTGVETRVHDLEAFRLDASPRLAVLEAISSDMKTTRNMTYGIALTTLLSVAAQVVQLNKGRS